MSHPTVAIVGAGATGAYLAARLARAHVPVLLAARGASAERIAEGGITVCDDAGTWTAHPTAVVDTGAGGLPNGQVDLVVVCVKTYDTAHVLPIVEALLSSRGSALSLQNGVRCDGELTQALGAEQVLTGVLYIGARRTGPGAVQCAAPPRIILGPYDGEDLGAAHRVGARFAAAGIDTSVDAQIQTAKWQKYLFNCGLNPLTALTGKRMGQLLADPGTAGVFTDLVAESVETARAAGAPLAADAVAAVHEIAQRMDISSSMAEDLEAGRPLELDAFSGHVLDLGREHDVPVPVTRTMHALLRSRSTAPPSHESR